MVVELRSRANFDDALALSRDHLVVVDFFAVWCPPCQRIAPLFQQLSEELPDVKFFKLDVDAVSDVARSEAIRAMPTFKFYRHGSCKETIQGGSPGQLRAAIARLRPPPPLLEPVLDLASAEGEPERREAGAILVKIATNILREPLNPKFRRLKVSNRIITEKLLIVSGAMQCLIAMGFRDSEDAFVLDPEKALDDVRLVKSQIEQIVLSENGGKCATGDPGLVRGDPDGLASVPSPASTPTSAAPATAPASAPTPVAMPLPNSPPAPAVGDGTAQFLARINQTVEMMAVYEQPHLQEKARTAMGWKTLSDRVDTADTGSLVRHLLSWFKEDFFSWTDAPPCPACDRKPHPVGAGQPSLAESEGWAGRVELFMCSDHGQVRFPRYNHPGKLLETRTGRCGEWANAFMLVLRSAGVRSRYVLDWTDHVWCEVFLKGRWVHCDPCEGALDKPLIYEAGWGKKLSYVLAFERQDVQDVTWRYTKSQAEVMTRRTEVPEAWLVSTLMSTRKRLQASLGPEDLLLRTRETLKELVEFLSPPREAEDGELIGRQSGSKEWREQRGELGFEKKASAASVIRPLKEELAANRIELRYSCSKDHYERPLAGDDSIRIVKGWRTLASSFSNVARKHEKDWKMVYLARIEGCPAEEPGLLEWTFDLSQCEKQLAGVRIMSSGAEFESGGVSFVLCGDNECCASVRGLYVNNTEFRGCRRVTLRAELRGGTGDLAWQHAQLFRQKDADDTLFPMYIELELEAPKEQ